MLMCKRSQCRAHSATSACSNGANDLWHCHADDLEITRFCLPFLVEGSNELGGALPFSYLNHLPKIVIEPRLNKLSLEFRDIPSL
jgi:hypothetical protein